MRILIVDDEWTIREGIRRTVETAFPAWMVGTAESGEQALSLLEEADVDVVFLDIMMPGMSGLDLLRQGVQLHKTIRWVVISAYSDFEFAQQALRYGAKDYILKPIGKPKVIELLQTLEAELELEQAALLQREQVQNQLLDAREAVFQCWAAGLDAADGRFDLGSLAAEYADCMLILYRMESAQDEMQWHVDARQEMAAWMNRHGKGFVVSFGRSTLLGVFSPSSSMERVQSQLLESLPGSVQGKSQLQVSHLLHTFGDIPDQVAAMLKNEAQMGEDPPYENHNEIIEVSMQYIKNHFNENLSLEKVAAAVYLNPVYFSHLFKKSTGTGYKEFVMQLRIEHAKQLLGTSSLKVTEVAERVGYQDLRHFTQVFRKLVQMTPSEYRGALKEEPGKSMR
ncbi:response regulator transcription factor [Paenibacillus eucommiae]|uniref:Two-component system response regulator YesN n=1 Tax=Paenibacillus eucommiae TaxID=1355755 RepID=A0ABS4IML8_9BACL|nr:response regulator [Paenibacillus eucommiae]MBP1988806.1 two-component system response regulator YesN [Paenibacillus eucommiae]